MAGWRKKQKRPDGSIYMLLPTIIREERVPQSSAARVALRWVGFFGSVLDFFFLPVLLNAGVHISSLEIFL